MTASLTVLNGPLQGTRLEIDDSADEVLIGSDPGCRFSLDLPGVSPIHARLWIDHTGLTVHDTRSARGVFVNQTRVDGEAPLGNGDVLSLGTPGEEDTVRLQLHTDAAGEPAIPSAEAPAFGAQEEPVDRPVDEPVDAPANEPAFVTEDVPAPVMPAAVAPPPVAEAPAAADLGDLFGAAALDDAAAAATPAPAA